MANADLKPSKHVLERFTVVSSVRQPRPIRTETDIYLPRPDLPAAPGIRLAGRWLEQVGFAIDGRARIQIEDGRLIISKREFTST